MMLGKKNSAELWAECFSSDCLHKRRMKEILVETIGILEDTRKAFKSKRLEDLRKRLIEALAENS